MSKNSLSLTRKAFFFLGILLCYTFGASAAHSQTNPNFNLRLLVDFSAAEQTIDLLEDRFIGTDQLAQLRGNRIAASTTELIANNSSGSSLLERYLDSLKYHQIIKEDVYRLEEARKNVAEIKALLGEVKRTNFNQRIAATVEQIFPTDAAVNVTIPVYIVTVGHENVDAYVRRIIWHGDTPQFVGEGEGELTIILNLAQSVKYGDNIQERFTSVLGVVAHEVFHAAFGSYKESSRAWKRYYRKYRNPIDVLLDLTHNEGIAYYLSLDQRAHEYLPRDWFERTREVVQTFNKNATELLEGKLSRTRIADLIRTANLSGYWESYGSMTGMFIAREIDLRMGRAALIQTIANGPFDLFQKYISLTQQESNLPGLSTPLSEYVLRETQK